MSFNAAPVRSAEAAQVLGMAMCCCMTNPRLDRTT